MNSFFLIAIVLIALLNSTIPFSVLPKLLQNRRVDVLGFRNTPPATATSRRMRPINMVFDFLRKRTEEGIAQVQNIASKTIEGKLGEALQSSADYIRLRQREDLENLKRLTDGSVH
jgi:hypothetical protein